MSDALQPGNPAGGCTLWWRQGVCGADIPAWITARIKELGTPRLSWLEPRPALAPGGARGQLPGYRTLYAGEPCLGFEVQEVRLFWPGRAVHVLAQPTPRWVEILEANPPKDGGWQSQNPLRRVDYTLRTRQDLSRRFAGLQAPADLPTVRMIEYWRGGSLIAWRIEGAEAARAAGRGPEG